MAELASSLTDPPLPPLVPASIVVSLATLPAARRGGCPPRANAAGGAVPRPGGGYPRIAAIRSLTGVRLHRLPPCDPVAAPPVAGDAVPLRTGRSVGPLTGARSAAPGRLPAWVPLDMFRRDPQRHCRP